MSSDSPLVLASYLARACRIFKRYQESWRLSHRVPDLGWTSLQATMVVAVQATRGGNGCGG